MHNDSTREPPPVKSPNADDFKAEAVQGAVMKESIQHPGTIYPLAGSGLALAWSLLIAPTPASVGLAFGLAFVGASAFVYNFVVKGPERAARHVTRLREMRRQYTDSMLSQLANDCFKQGFSLGRKEANDMRLAWRQLADYLEENKTGVASDRFRILAEDSCHQGVSVLEQALSIFKAMRSIDVDSLNRELFVLRQHLAALDERCSQAKTLHIQIDSHLKRLHLYEQSKERLEQLLAEANEIELALQSTYLELADLGNQSIDEFLSEGGGASNRLVSAVEAARIK